MLMFHRYRIIILSHKNVSYTFVYLAESIESSSAIHSTETQVFGGTRGCRYDNLLYCEWRQIRNYDNSRVLGVIFDILR